MTYITDLPQANSIDPVQDMLAIVTNSLNATQKIDRNTYLGLSSAPVGLTDSQTLTNKTLTSPTINGATLSGTLSGTYTIGGSPTFPSTVVTTTGSQTLTNKNLSSPVISTPIITNATISSDAYVGFSSSTSGSIFGMSVTGSVLSSAALAGAVNSAALQSGAVTTNSVADSAITPAKLLAGTGTGWSWQTWTPTITGFSANPAGGVYRYIQIGKTVFLSVGQPANGTSNSTTFTISLPIAAATITNMQWSGFGTVADNGVSPTSPGLLNLPSGSTVVNVYKDAVGGGFTASGGKRLAWGTIIYEVA